MTLGEAKAVGDTNLLFRGERDQRGPAIPRRFPQVIAGAGQQPLGERTKDSGRLLVADWITSAEIPLTARVLANRVWQRLLGQGLVATPNDFGLQGEPNCPCSYRRTALARAHATTTRSDDSPASHAGHAPGRDHHPPGT